MTRTRSLMLYAASAVALVASARAVRTARQGLRTRMPDRSAMDEPQVHNEDLDTYQDLLDESLHLTFPASDPISAHAATRCSDEMETPANRSDWRLHPGSANGSAAGAGQSA